MPSSQPRFEEVAGQRLPLGGVNGYLGVRGKQGRGKDKFQGVTPRKQHRTGLFDSPLQAAVAFAQLKEDLDLGMLAQRSRKKRASPATLAASRKAEVGTYLGHLRPPPPPVVPLQQPPVACALLSQQQAAAAAARGVAVAYADVAV